MKIKIMRKKECKNSEIIRYRSITIPLPLWVLRFKYVWKSISKVKNGVDYLKIGDEIYNLLKTYIRENGHFMLLELESKDTIIKIFV